MAAAAPIQAIPEPHAGPAPHLLGDSGVKRPSQQHGSNHESGTALLDGHPLAEEGLCKSLTSHPTRAPGTAPGSNATAAAAESLATALRSLQGDAPSYQHAQRPAHDSLKAANSRQQQAGTRVQGSHGTQTALLESSLQPGLQMQHGAHPERISAVLQARGSPQVQEPAQDMWDILRQVLHLAELAVQSSVPDGRVNDRARKVSSGAIEPHDHST